MIKSVNSRRELGMSCRVSTTIISPSSKFVEVITDYLLALIVPHIYFSGFKTGKSRPPGIIVSFETG
ncbi:BgTH12-04958 [Blumeria graminis f. sp. triticale]|uniref:BgTH12-04958 n=1 Tax=Blumeria graminis f. sp. triticale TaxID=1689686 RepID=A0A9W4D6R9_BLUGR|nr:BgTH12-04958 [Blumeria graminis f. sp. triticale]